MFGAKTICRFFSQDILTPQHKPHTLKKALMFYRNLGLTGVAFGVFLYYQLTTDDTYSRVKEIDYTEFDDLFRGGRISLVEIRDDLFGGKDSDCVYVHLSDSKVFKLRVSDLNSFVSNLEEIQGSSGTIDFKRTVYPAYDHPRLFALSFATTISLLYLVLFKYQLFLPVQNLLMKKPPSRLVNPSLINKGFEDIIGLDNAKKEVLEFVQFLTNAQLYKRLGARTPRGALLTGPPGTGKTLLVKACAKESGISFFYLSGSEFVNKYVGVGAGNVRSLFQQAKENAPSIVFIDEIDSIGRQRESGFSNQEKKHTLNQLLVEMDGFDTDS